MPLANMGLVRSVDNQEVALGDAHRVLPDRSSQRMVRCAAGFYDDPRRAESAAAALRARFGLSDHQVTVISPSGLTRSSFGRVARRWQCLRPNMGRRHQLLRTACGALAGLVTGGLAASLGWAVANGGDSVADALGWFVPGLWAGALAGAVTTVVVTRRRAHHRFDQAVAHKLRRGFDVVVAHGLVQGHEGPVLAYLQDSSHSWCAEAPMGQWRV